MMIAGETLAGEAIQQLRQRIEGRSFTSGDGAYSEMDVRETYLQRILRSDVDETITVERVA